MNFFQLTLICPLVVSPGQTFTCTIQMSFNLPSGGKINEPFAVRVYPTFESTYDSFDMEAPLPTTSLNSFGFNSSVLSTQISLTYDSSRSSRTIYAFPPDYGSAYAQQTIYVVNSKDNLYLNSYTYNFYSSRFFGQLHSVSRLLSTASLSCYGLYQRIENFGKMCLGMCR